MNKEAAKITAKWWRDRISKLNHDNGDSSQQSQLAGMFADLLAAKNAPSVEQLDKFEANLTHLISKENIVEVHLDCDYTPCIILYEAAMNAGIEASVFPWKVNTITTDNLLKVSDGYAKPWVDIEIK